MKHKEACIYDAKIAVNYFDNNGHRYYGPRMIVCTSAHNCASCGWNPAVEEARKAAIRAKMEAEREQE